MKCVVTGVNQGGKSYVVSSEDVTVTMGVVWSFEPADIQPIIDAIPDGVAAEFLESGPGGAKLTYASVPPAGGESSFEMDHPQGIDEDGWHVTRTLDFVYIASGELVLVLEEETVTLKPGDFVVQQATRHAWRNEGSEPVVMIGVIITPPSRSANT
jgi:mannose-6-phosphate isomerase-like protein (cupin superfamily)